VFKLLWSQSYAVSGRIVLIDAWLLILAREVKQGSIWRERRVTPYLSYTPGSSLQKPVPPSFSSRSS